MELNARNEADPLELFWWENYIQSMQLNGISDKDLCLAMTEALSGPYHTVIPRIISEVKQARRIFKEICREKGVFNIRLFQMLLEQRQDYDLAYNLAVTHGLWGLALNLQNAPGVLPKTKKNAFKEAIRVQAWEAVYMMVSTNATSSMICRNTFLTLIRNYHFQAALHMISRRLYLPSVGDVKFAIKISFEVGDCSSSLDLLVERFRRNKTCAKKLVKCYVRELKKMIHNTAHGLRLPMLDSGNSRQNEMIIWQFLNPLSMFLFYFTETENSDFLTPIFKYFFKQSLDWKSSQLFCRLCTVCYKNDALLRYAARMAITVPEVLVTSLILTDEMLKSRLLTLSLKLAVSLKKGEFLTLAAEHATLLQLTDFCPIFAAYYRSPDKWPLFVPTMEKLLKRLSSTEMPPLEIKSFISQHLKRRRKLISLIKWCSLNSCYRLAASMSAVISQNKLFLINLRKMGPSLPSGWDNAIFEVAKKQSVAWKDKKYWKFVVPVVEKKLHNLQCEYDLIATADTISDATNHQQRLQLLKWAAGHSFFNFCFLLSLLQNDLKSAAKNIIHLSKLSEMWDYVVPDMQMDSSAWQHRSLWRLLVPQAEREIINLEEDDPDGLEPFSYYLTDRLNDTLLKHIKYWCYKHSFHRLCLLLAVYDRDYRLLVKSLNKIETTRTESWDTIVAKTLTEPSLWERPSYRKTIIPILDRLLQNAEDNDVDEELVEVLKHGISPSVLKKCSQWSKDNSYFHFHFALAVSRKNCKMILKCLRNSKEEPPSVWLDDIFETTMNASTWKVLGNWDLLVPVLEQKILDVDDSDEFESLVSCMKNALGINLMDRLCKWCVDNCFHLSSLLFLATSSIKNWPLMQEIVTKDERQIPFTVLSFVATVALEYKSFELTMACVDQMDSDYLIEHFLQYAITSSQNIEVGGLINFCKTKGMQDWVVKLSVLSDQWVIVDQEKNLSTMVTRNFAMKKACEANQWVLVCKWLQRDAWEESVLVDVLRRAVSAGECACATIVFDNLNPLTVDSTLSTTLLSRALQLSGDKRNTMFITCIKNGLGGIQTADDIYQSPLHRALRLDVSLQFPIVKALFESGACTARSLVQAERHNLGYLNPLRCSPQVKKFAEHVSSMPRSLQSLCRLSISHRIGCCAGRQGRIHSLPLPNVLKDYLMFSDLKQELCDS